MRCFNGLAAVGHRLLGVVLLIVGCTCSLTVSAGCGFDGASTAVLPNGPLIFEKSGYKLLGARYWYDDSRYPVSSLMGVDKFSLQPKACASLGGTFSDIIAIVYRPPANAVRGVGNTYRIPSDASGVTIEIEFPTGSPHPSGGLLLSESRNAAVNGAITDVRAQFPPFVVRLSLVKTAVFSSERKSQPITFGNGLGTITYYGKSTSQQASSENAVQMPTYYADKYQAQAMAPSCKLKNVGGASAAAVDKIIKMSAVNTTDFNGQGAIEKSSKAAKLWFSCSGTANTKPTVYFEATYPLGDGNNGVGMPKEGSDIGVQLLFNKKNIKFGYPSSSLGWKTDLYNDTTITAPNYGVLASRGSYCKTDCGDDMSGSNWVDGGARYNNDNEGFDSEITVKYYQTTDKTPKVQSFSVPFTVTLELQ